MTNRELLETIVIKLESIDQRLGRVEQRLDKVEQRLDRVEQRLDSLEQRFDSLEQRVSNLESGQIAMEAEIGPGDPSAQIIRGNDADGQVEESLQNNSGKKAAVIADNTGTTESTGGTMNENNLKNPYTDPVFVLRVPQAPEEEDSNLVDGDYQWQKPKVSKGIQ